MMKIYDLNANYHHSNTITVFTNLTSKQQMIVIGTACFPEFNTLQTI